MDSYGIFAVLLLLGGLTLLVAEVFIPSGGVLAICTTIALLLSAVCAYFAWYYRAPGLWWSYCGLLIVLIPSTLIGAFYVLPKTAVGKRVLLEAPRLDDVQPYREETARLQKLVGRYGQTVTPLKPGGLVLVDGERLHAFSEGISVEPHASVEVIAVRGTRLLVRPGEPPAAGDVSPSGETARREDHLDFEIPAG